MVFSKVFSRIQLQYVTIINYTLGAMCTLGYRGGESFLCLLVDYIAVYVNVVMFLQHFLQFTYIRDCESEWRMRV